MDHSEGNTLIVIGLGILLVITIIISFRLGRYPIPTKEVLGISLSKIYPIEQFWTDQVEMVLINIRLPRIILACLVGCCLSATGRPIRVFFKTPWHLRVFWVLLRVQPLVLPLPFLIMEAALWSPSVLFLQPFNGIFSLFDQQKVKGNKILGLILSGIIVSSLFSAATSFIKLVADPTDQLPAITYWLMGSLAGAKIGDIKFVIIPMTIGLVPLLLLRWRMNVLTMGDDEARTMGVNANQVRFIVIFCSTLTTAASVSVSGMIGWVGLVIPHLARKLVGTIITI